MILGKRLLIAFITLCGLSASAITFTTDTFINFSNTNYDGQDIVVTNCTLTINGTHNFASLLVQNGGVVTHSFATNGLMQDNEHFQEWFTFTNTNTLVLITNVLTNTILITDVSFSVTYTNGVDYEVTWTTSGLEITRTSLSSIPEDEEVFIQYQSLSTLGLKMNLMVAGDVTVEPGGAVDVNLKGFGSGNGPGTGWSQSTNSPYLFTAGSGGGHGGLGGISASRAPGGSAYGSPLAPSEKGSAGGTGSGPGGVGGGAVRISAGGELRVDGRISADGMNGTNAHSGGGSGGSIWLIANTLYGSGTISANGGAGEPSNGGGGGGGRIALVFSTNEFTGAISSRGGSGSTYGGAGSIYTSGQVGMVKFENGGVRGAASPFATQSVDLSISNGAAVEVSNTTTSVRNLHVGANGWLSHAANQSSLIFTVTGQMTIEPGGGLDVNGRGWTSGLGSGMGRSVSFTGSGAGYGGMGGNSSSNAVGGTFYGSLSSPIDRGSGGGAGFSGALGGSGGGSVRLTVVGNLTLNGTISANGTMALGTGAGGGSGGGIYLDVGTISGSGTISAKGGDGDLPNGGGGGGGRVAIRYTTNNFNGSIAAHGGRGAHNGGAGPIYWFGKNVFKAALVVDGGGNLATNTTVIMDASAPVDLTVTGGATLRYSPYSSYPNGNLFIASNSWLTAVSTNNASVALTFSNATILEGGGITMEGIGYQSGAGPGYGAWTSLPGSIAGTGGGHGGPGGNSAAIGPVGGNSYDSAMDPITSGSGGGGPATGGAGGGVLRLTVTRTLNLGGRLTANGFNAQGPGAGGGAGGSIYLNAGILMGNGSISANGGAGDLPFGGGGGGGRIAISTDTNLFLGTITARGGAGTNYGGAGTIYFKPTQTARPLLTVENGGWKGATTVIPPMNGYYDMVVSGAATVIPTNGIANLTVFSNSWLLLSNASLVISNNASIHAGAGINMNGRGSPANQGPAPGMTLSSTGGGGGYGGPGGSSSSGASGGGHSGLVGSPTQPIITGSGGGYFGGAGGGVVRVTVNQTLTLDGIITADGMAGLTNNSGGGSGGSIWLTLGRLAGTGLISANGGSGKIPGGGGGGGGRIALEYGTNDFSGLIAARGGSGYNNGGAGTIFLKPTAFQGTGIPLLLIDNGGMTGMRTPLPLIGGTINLTVTNSATAVPYAQQSIANLAIGANSALVVTSRPTTLTMTITSNATIHAGGSLSVSGMGYATGINPGTGGYQSSSYGYTRGGGGHGGYGGASIAGVFGGVAHGSVSSPVGYGGNAGGDSYSQGGSGGGALRFTVNGKLIVDGTLTSDGNYGGGAGGSIWLTVGTLAGTGIISADGGESDSPYNGGGGGGRVAIYYGTNMFSGTLSAHGGSGANTGGAGTIYTKANNQSIANIIVGNGDATSSSTILSLSSFSGPYDLTVRSGASLILGGNSTAANVYIQSNAWIIGASNISWSFTVTSNLTIEPGGGITLTGKGPISNQGTGSTISSNPYGYTGAGGGHGGYGGKSAGGANGGNLYGIVTAPTSYSGSRGGNNGGFGGGSMHLTVNGNLTVNGTIVADGDPGVASASGGGSGGSIQINVGRLLGEGTISAKGGSGEMPYGGGGGGGRIAIQYYTNNFTGTVTARGGIGANAGGPGTVYYKPYLHTYGHVVVDNAGLVATNTILPFLSNTHLTVSGASTVIPTSSQTVGNLVIASNSSLSCNPGQSFTFTVISNAIIEAGGRIDLVAKGAVGGSYNSTGFYSGNGGGHGGFGGIGIGGTTAGGTSGVIATPTTVGGGGGTYPGFGPSAIGGGVLRLIVSRTLTVNGQIIADGTDATAQNGGGGAGGSVWIDAGTLNGNGWISANGGMGETPYGGGGGGGRIAIYCPTNNFAGDITSWGGIGFVTGGAGTIYTVQSTNRHLLIANGGWRGTNTPVAMPNSDTSLTVSEGAVVHPTSSEVIVDNLTVTDEGLLTHLGTQTNLNIIVRRHALIASNSLVSVDGKGFNGSNPGPGAGAMFLPNSGSGGGHGGIGGNSASGTPGGVSYGSLQQPTDRGSKGGTGNSANYSEGGGVIRMQVGGTLHINGNISANGTAGVLDKSGGGAGGSIWLTAGRVEGNGRISTDGGAGEPFEGGGGAGGRIAIYSATNSFAGLITSSGAPGAGYGADGTIFLGTELPAPYVMAQSPTGLVFTPVSSIDLTFNSPLNPSSLFGTNISLTGPAGIVSGISFSTPSISTLRITFPQQSMPGTYDLEVRELSDIYNTALAAPYAGTFSILPSQVAGIITNSAGEPISGVTVQTSDNETLITDASGTFAFELPPYWSGTITPVPGEWTFVPVSRSYTNVAGIVTNQGFVGVTEQQLTLAGQRQGTNLCLGWNGVSGLTYRIMCSSNLQDWVLYSGPFTGSNGNMEITLPTDAGANKFFQLDVR